jgi:predicted MPP superfamily phosphohydrolase
MKHPRKPFFPELIGQWPTTFFIYECIVWGLVLGIPVSFLFSFALWIKIFLFLIWICVVWGSFVESQKLNVRTLSISDPKFPKLRIVVMSDIHAGPYKKTQWVERCVQTINNQSNIDLVCLPGDFVFGGAEKYAPHLKPLKQINCPLLFATLGNHDHDPNPHTNMKQWVPVTRILEQCGIVELKNDSFFWTEKGIWILGVDDNYWGYHDLKKTFSGVDHHPKILLAHSPDIIDDLDTMSLHADIILCGHTHGGQVRFPGFGSVPGTIPTNHGKAHQEYVYRTKRGLLVISRGVGETGIRSRFWNPPEILVLEIN